MQPTTLKDMAEQSEEQSGERLGSSAEAASGDQAPLRRSMSWRTMLVWIVVAFLLAGIVAYRLVSPFFHRA